MQERQVAIGEASYALDDPFYLFPAFHLDLLEKRFCKKGCWFQNDLTV